MNKKFIHRSSRYLRLVLSTCLVFQGVFVPGRRAFAANPDALQIGVRPGSTKPPDPVAGLLASANPAVQGQISLTWTSPQGVAGGDPIPNQSVESYTVQYATFSVDSLAGDTTAWWLATAGSSLALAPPGYTPQSPGQLEAYALSSLTPGVTFYFGIKSTSQTGALSPIDVNSAIPGAQASAFSTQFVLAPSSFTGTALSTGSIQWSWALSSGATGYIVYSVPDNTPIQNLPAGTSTWLETGLTPNTFYIRKVRATDAHSISADSPESGLSTLAAVPTSLSVTGVTDTTINLTWSANGNPVGTNYSIERSPDGVGFTAVSQLTATQWLDSGLAADSTYYYRVQAFNGSGVATAYSTVISTQTAPSSIQPLAPNGLSAGVVNGEFVLSWHPVLMGTGGVPVTIGHYRVDQYDGIGGNLIGSFPLSPGVTTYQAPAGSQVSYFRVVALSAGGAASPPSDYVDSSPQANRYAVASDDPNTRVVIPSIMAREMLAANNATGVDLEINLTRRAQDENDNTVRSYNIDATDAATGNQVNGFAFSQTAVSVQLGYATLLGSPQLFSSARAGARAISDVGVIAQILSVFWFNGSSYIRISDPILTDNQALAVSVRNLGVYQIRAMQLPGSTFALARGSPYPRIITPNNPTQNNRVFFFFDNPESETVVGTIYDLRGAKVRDLQVDSLSPTPNCLVWNGRDSQGAVVPTGVYLYKIAAGKTALTGTVVVAR